MNGGYDLCIISNLTNCNISLKENRALMGIEPMAFPLLVQCSTDSATV